MVKSICDPFYFQSVSSIITLERRERVRERERERERIQIGSKNTTLVGELGDYKESNSIIQV